jgi:predicted RNA-binding Zn ribbon-like protein
VHFNTYTYAGAHIAAWLVNHPAPDATELSVALDDYDVHEPAATIAQARALRPWALLLRDVFLADTLTEKALRTDALLVAADCRPRLVSHGPGMAFHFHYTSVRAGLPARVRVLTAAGLAHIIDDGAGSRLQSCSRAGCGTVFIDTSRNGRRHFCSVRCANQVNVANHRRRRRETRHSDFSDSRAE